MPRQKAPGAGECRLSWMILVLLAGIGAFVYREHLRYNPAVRILQQPAGSGSPLLPSRGEDADTIIPVPPGMMSRTPPERFSASNLADKINGKADLYLASGFQELYCRRFVARDDGDFFMEVFSYDMGSARNAFAVFSLQRRSGAVGLDITPFSYRAENALFFAHGRHYVEMIATRVSDDAMERMRSAALQFIRKHPAPAGEILEPGLFPEPGRVAESVKLIAADAFGFDQFTNIFTADYQAGEKRLTAFLSIRPTGQEAVALLEKYHRFLLDFGGEEAGIPLDIPNAKAVSIMDTYEIVFTSNRILAGVREAEDPQAALQLARLIQQELIRHGE
ncbi:MAG: DUF6599 family protein [Thermodesulfobacteriota bacterium]